MALPHSKNIFEYPARFQFGQPYSPCAGKSCCTDTCIQQIIEFYKDKTYTLNTVRKAAQSKTSFNENPCTGINAVEVLNALKYFGITHYRKADNVDGNFVRDKTDIGPVLVGVYYGSYPNASRGTNRAEVGGRTDTFRGSHAVLAIGKRLHKVGTKSHWDIYTRDPDHNSPSRPERPKYDIITATQLNVAMHDLPRYTAFRTTYCIYPTKKK